MGKFKFIIFTLVVLLLASCDTNAGTINLTFNETSAEITETTVEVVRMNNCGGKGDAKQTDRRSKSVNVELSGKIGVDKVVINGEVSAKYGEQNETAKEIELLAPASTNMEFVIEWTDKVWGGFVTKQGEDGQANYKVSVPISVALVSNRDLGCESSQSEEASTNLSDESVTSSAPTVLPNSLSIIDVTNNKSYTFDYPPDANAPTSCAGAYLETGRAITEYQLIIPEAWVVVIDSWKAEWPSGSYQNDGILIITGEWQGNVIVNTGAICVSPASILQSVLETRRNLTGNDGRLEYTIP